MLEAPWTEVAPTPFALVIMITGYNTDVTHKRRAFHVQTEDKGEANPFIESLIYVGGQVLAAKRTGYAAVLEEGRGLEAVLEMMDRQHRSMISAIQAGEYDGKVVELFGGADDGDELPPLPRTPERSLDEVILDYLSTEARQERLTLQLEEDVELSFGERTPLSVRTSLSRSGMPVEGAAVVFKMISTVSEPEVLAEGATDDEGTLRVEVEIPEHAQGNSALIITASSEVGRSELKYLL